MPSPVDKYFDEVRKSNPGYSDEQAWATAWSIACKNGLVDAKHCHKAPSEYLTGKSAGRVDPNMMRPIQLDSKEISRADESGHTVVVRPQSDGGYMVAVVKVEGSKGISMGKSFTRYVDQKDDIARTVKELVRWLDKMGYEGMGGPSRFRVAARFLSTGNQPTFSASHRALSDTKRSRA
jgi:hypothetical protein